MLPRFTIDNLTDTDIAAVYRAAVGPGGHQLADADLMHDTSVALNRHGDFTTDEQKAARGRCVAWLNDHGYRALADKPLEVSA